MSYDTWKTETPPEYTDTEICKECQGKGTVLLSECCGATIDEDILICMDCKEHSGLQECEECNGKGIVNIIKL